MDRSLQDTAVERLSPDHIAGLLMVAFGAMSAISNLTATDAEALYCDRGTVMRRLSAVMLEERDRLRDVADTPV